MMKNSDVQRFMTARDNTKLSYRIHNEGNRDVMLFLHGAGSNNTVWYNITDVLERSMAGSTLIIPEFRGHGRSAVGDIQNYSLDILCDDIIELIDGLGKIDHLTIIGNSLGSAVAICIERKIPEQIDKMILFSLFGRNITRYSTPLKMLNNCAYGLIRHFPMRKKLDFQNYAALRAKAPWYFPIVDIKGTNLHVYSRAVDAVLGYNIDLKGINRRTMIVQGMEDVLVRNDRIQKNARKNDNINMVFIKTEHLVINKEPEKCAELIMRFVEGDDPC